MEFAEEEPIAGSRFLFRDNPMLGVTRWGDQTIALMLKDRHSTEIFELARLAATYAGVVLDAGFVGVDVAWELRRSRRISAGFREYA